jgi:protein-S-isoprenylcysteine O-methyltransferase Ste14
MWRLKSSKDPRTSCLPELPASVWLSGGVMETERIFRIIQGLVFLIFVLHRAYYTRKFPPQEDETIEKQALTPAGRVANMLALPALVALLAYVFAPQYINWAGLPLPAWLRWFGVLLTVDGFALLQWAHFSLGKNWSDQPRIMESQQMVHYGPYRFIRHPMYSAFLLILGSSLLVSANWLLGGLWILITWVDIQARIRYEEDRMLARFGEAYREYMERTGALFPRGKG